MTATVRKILLSLPFYFLILFAAAQTTGKVLETQTIQSKVLGKNVNYTVYLPADYSTSQRSYPVVYLLHGFTDDNTGWMQFGEINRYADKAIADGTIPPMIIVMPNGDSSFYINSYDGKENYEDFFVNEFMPAVEKEFRIKAEKKYRGVAGLSMGGYGTLIYALKHPDLFAAAAPFSAAVWDDDGLMAMPESNYNTVIGKLYGKDLKGKSRLTKAWYDNAILKIVSSKTTDELKKVRYWIDCGDDDFLTKGNCLLPYSINGEECSA